MITSAESSATYKYFQTADVLIYCVEAASVKRTNDLDARH